MLVKYLELSYKDYMKQLTEDICYIRETETKHLKQTTPNHHVTDRARK